MINFLWLDCEMTGLDYQRDHILEIACILTNCQMIPLAEYHAVIHHNDGILNTMNEWCQSTHSSSGLINAVKKSNLNYTDVQLAIMRLLKTHSIPQNIYIAGNSVYNDLYFIKKYMPEIADFLHYRIFDITAFKILAMTKKISPFAKKNQHTAFDDIKESIAEYQYYQKILFK